MEDGDITKSEPTTGVSGVNAESTIGAQPENRKRRGRPRRDSIRTDSISQGGNTVTSSNADRAEPDSATDNGLAEISQGDIKLVSLEDILGRDDKKEEKPVTTAKEVEKRGRPVGWQAKATESVVDLFLIGAEWLNEPKFALSTEEESKLSSNLRGFLNSLDIKIQKRLELALEKQLPVVLLLITLGTIILPRLRLLGEKKKLEKQSISDTNVITNLSRDKAINNRQSSGDSGGEIRHKINPIYFNK